MMLAMSEEWKSVVETTSREVLYIDTCNFLEGKCTEEQAGHH